MWESTKMSKPVSGSPSCMFYFSFGSLLQKKLCFDFPPRNRYSKTKTMLLFLASIFYKFSRNQILKSNLNEWLFFFFLSWNLYFLKLDSLHVNFRHLLSKSELQLGALFFSNAVWVFETAQTNERCRCKRHCPVNLIGSLWWEQITQGMFRSCVLTFEKCSQSAAGSPAALRW